MTLNPANPCAPKRSEGGYPSNALTSVYLSLPDWSVDKREYTIGIHAREDGRLLATETHKFRFKAFELALQKARSIEAEAAAAAPSAISDLQSEIPS